MSPNSKINYAKIQSNSPVRHNQMILEKLRTVTNRADESLHDLSALFKSQELPDRKPNDQHNEVIADYFGGRKKRSDSSHKLKNQ